MTIRYDIDNLRRELESALRKADEQEPYLAKIHIENALDRLVDIEAKLL